MPATNPHRPSRPPLRPAPACLARAAAALLALAACRDRDGPGTANREEPPQPPSTTSRAFLPAEWDTVFRIGGTVDDTLLIRPSELAADSAGVYVLDFGAQRVLAFGPDGRLRWSFGRRGQGPGEFSAPRDIEVDGAGRVWVLDPENVRITVLDRAGTPVASIPLDRVGRVPDDLAPLADDQTMLIGFSADSPLTRIDRAGRVLERQPFPWPGYARLNEVQAQTETARDPVTGRWAAAFRLGDRFYLFDGPRWNGVYGRYVEPVDFPRPIEERSGNTVTRRVARRISAARALAFSPTRLYVLFAGTTPHRLRVVDTYTLDTGEYRGSFLLPRPVSTFTHAGGTIYALYDDPYPALVAWRPAGPPLP